MAQKHNKKAIMNHLRSIDLSVVDWNDRPLTQSYHTNKQACADPVLTFLEHMYFEKMKDAKTSIEYIDLGMSILHAFHSYLECWMKMKQEHINIHNHVTFGTALTKMCDTSNGAVTKIVNWGKEKRRAYKFDMALLAVFLKSKGLMTEISYMIADDY